MCKCLAYNYKDAFSAKIKRVFLSAVSEDFFLADQFVYRSALSLWSVSSVIILKTKLRFRSQRKSLCFFIVGKKKAWRERRRMLFQLMSLQSTTKELKPCLSSLVRNWMREIYSCLVYTHLFLFVFVLKTENKIHRKWSIWKAGNNRNFIKPRGLLDQCLPYEERDSRNTRLYHRWHNKHGTPDWSLPLWFLLWTLQDFGLCFHLLSFGTPSPPLLLQVNELVNHVN